MEEKITMRQQAMNIRDSFLKSDDDIIEVDTAGKGSGVYYLLKSMGLPVVGKNKQYNLD